MRRIEVGKASELAEGGTLKFAFDREGISIEGFAVCVHGAVLAYENRCRHLPLALDYGDNRFFTADNRYLICRNHGALFEPSTGYCVQGPCRGASLWPLRVEVDPADQTIWLLLEESA